jgi:hypothetical protein
MYVHIALFRWKAGVTSADIGRSLAEVEALFGKVPGLVEISTAVNTSKYNEGYTHVVLVRAETQSAIDAYRAHPDHVKVAQRIEAMEERGVGVDFETQ